MAAENHSLEPILRQIRAAQTKTIQLPPCPACGRKLKTGITSYQKKGKTVVSIALWCGSCTAATGASDVDPVPPWAAPPDGSGPTSSGG